MKELLRQCITYPLKYPRLYQVRCLFRGLRSEVRHLRLLFLNFQNEYRQ